MGDTDRVHARFPWSVALSDPNPDIATLSADQVRGLRLPWTSRYSPETLRAHLLANPGMSMWVPRTGEYLVTEPWRRRADIAHIAEAHARRGKQALVEATLDRARENGYRMVLLSDDVWNASPKLYAGLGLQHIERIVFFQKDLRASGQQEVGAQLPAIEVSRAGWRDLDLLLSLDHDSFPWLWWNSRPEFEEYFGMNGVSIFIARSNSEPVGYASFTLYRGWAHLDRLAVVVAQQGRRLGAAQLAHSLRMMRELGAASVGLSTQQSNTQSHSLYKRFGFKQTREQMNFYGVNLIRDAEV
ncbi:MAG TPA: GNAT family N-acetyltransferase [Chloroflexia bacterium]|nr:GNAT family N-acetyltransferase [Chloroflexia bacterium]